MAEASVLLGGRQLVNKSQTELMAADWTPEHFSFRLSIAADVGLGFA